MVRLITPCSLVILALSLGAGCDSGLDNDLVGTTWVLDRLDLPPGDSTQATPTTVRFESATQVAIDSCNDCGGEYRSDGHVLDFTLLVCTEIGCGNQLDLGPRLGTADRVVYSLSDDGLILVAEEDSVLSTFTFVAAGGRDGDD